MQTSYFSLRILSVAVLSILLRSKRDWLVVAQDSRTTNLLDSCSGSGWTLGGAGICEFSPPEFIAYRAFRRYTIPVPPGANYDLAITVESRRGDVDIQLLAPNGTVLASSAERIGEDVVQIGRTVLSRTPGNYTLLMQAVAQSESWYSVRAQTTSAVTRLAPEDRAVLSAIASQCCAPDDDLLPDACTLLFAATAANATAEDDLCVQPPNICNAQGRLTKLVLSGGDRGNFVCPSFPEELGQLAELQVLDWTSNGQVGTLASVAAVLAPLAGSLKRLYLGRNALSGPLGCELVSGTALEILRLDKNLINGPVPACMFQSPSLRQLSLAGNLLSGPLPALPPGCALKLLDVSENGPPLGASPSNPGIQGALPDFSLAPNLTYINLQSNSLTGPIPPLPRGLQVLLAASNGLTGSLPASLESAADLRVLDLSRNRLTGALPPRVVSAGLLTVLRLAGNQLDGALPSGGWGPYLMDVDLSGNSFTGQEVSELLNRTSLIKLHLASNNLTFDIGVLANRVPLNNSMLYFNISYNNVYGQLTEALGRMLLFHQVMQQAVQDDEALQGSLPPQPLFDISYNFINSTFPLHLLPPLAQLYWSSPYDYIPLSLKLQPQKQPSSLACPSPKTALPPDVFYLDELQQLYDLKCTTLLGQQINISSFQNVTYPHPPRRPGLPRPPPPLPPRPRRWAPPPNATRANTTTNTTIAAGKGGDGVKAPPPHSSETYTGSAPPPGGSSAAGGSGTAEGAGGDAQPGLANSVPESSSNDDAGKVAGKGGGNGGGRNVGLIAGGTIGGLVLVAVIAAAVVFIGRRSKARRSSSASKRVPLTYNSAYEAPSEGTASNYADMQMFEFNMISDRPPRHRTRLP